MDIRDHKLDYFQMRLSWKIDAKSTFHAVANRHSVLGTSVEKQKSAPLNAYFVDFDYSSSTVLIHILTPTPICNYVTY